MKHFFKNETKNSRFYAFCYRLFLLFRAFLIVAICLFVGRYLSTVLRDFDLLRIPGSIVGLLLLFLLLTLHIIPVHWVQNGCRLLTRYMIILFLPAAMGIMETYPLLLKDWGPIFIGSIASTLIVLTLIAYLTQKIMRDKHSDHEQNDINKVDS
jgi:holin-like protein